MRAWASPRIKNTGVQLLHIDWDMQLFFPSMITTVITLVLSVSAYTPGANAISGGSVMANGRAPHIGAYACPRAIPLGWRVILHGAARERAMALGMPYTGICADRFAARYQAGHIDICLPRGYARMSDAQRLRMAYRWGRVSGVVVFQAP